MFAAHLGRKRPLRFFKIALVAVLKQLVANRLNLFRCYEIGDVYVVKWKMQFLSFTKGFVAHKAHKPVAIANYIHEYPVVFQ